VIQRFQTREERDLDREGQRERVEQRSTRTGHGPIGVREEPWYVSGRYQGAHDGVRLAGGTRTDGLPVTGVHHSRAKIDRKTENMY
jgi:hypothetical protein